MEPKKNWMPTEASYRPLREHIKPVCGRKMVRDHRLIFFFLYLTHSMELFKCNFKLFKINVGKYLNDLRLLKYFHYSVLLCCAWNAKKLLKKNNTASHLHCSAIATALHLSATFSIYFQLSLSQIFCLSILGDCKRCVWVCVTGPRLCLIVILQV